MIAVDTNVVVRLLVNDDPEQGRRARLLFEENSIWIGTTVLLETEWVLRSAYKHTTMAIHNAFEKLLGLPQVTIGEPTVVVPALNWYAHGLDFSDALHLSAAAHAHRFATFDRALQRSADKIAGTPTVVAP